MGKGIATSILVSGLSRLFPERLSGVLDAARSADASGIDQIAVTDHLAIGPNTDAYPYGKFPFSRDEPWLEPLTTLAAIAGTFGRGGLGPDAPQQLSHHAGHV